MANSKIFKAPSRGKIRKVIRANVKREKNLKNDSTDLLAYMNYLLFMKSLIQKAKELQESDKSGELNVVHLNNIKEDMLKKFRG